MNDQVRTASTDWIGVATLLIVVSFFSSFCILIWQVYGYLRLESWRSLSTLDVLRSFEMKWAITPTDWLGLYRILEWMPLSLSLPIVGIVLALIAGWQDDSV